MMLMRHYQMVVEGARWCLLGFMAPAVGWEWSKQRRKVRQRYWPWLLFATMAVGQFIVMMQDPVRFTELYSSPREDARLLLPSAATASPAARMPGVTVNPSPVRPPS